MSGTPTPPTERGLDIAIVGAGAAGAYLAYRLIKARPDWRIGLYERSRRIGGRLWSVSVDGLPHPIELGGMRYLTSHPFTQSLVTELGFATRSFDVHDERSYLRNRIGAGPADPAAGAGYDLPPAEAGRSAIDLLVGAFLRIAPEARGLDDDGWRRLRATARFGDRLLTDWSLDDAVATILSPDGHRFAKDAFGYYSGIGPHCAPDAIQYLMGSGHPVGGARVPIGGMARIPGELVARFQALGGIIRFGHDVRRIEMEEGSVVIGFADGSGVRAGRLVLTLPIPGLVSLAESSPIVAGAAWQRLYASAESFPATKLYCWYDRPWWRDGPNAPTGQRTTTDLPNRKVFYLDEAPDRPAAIIAGYTDGAHVEPIISLADGVTGGSSASSGLLEATRRWLQATHPGAEVPAPIGSAFQHWGADPRELGWAFWLPGSNSDDTMERAIQPDASLPIHLCGDTFSRRQGWVEGALETADAVAASLLQPVAGATERQV